MNKIQLKIIELIKPYMDKEESKGCIFYDDNMLYFKWGYYKHFDCEVIGHYDISSVLKCINNNMLKGCGLSLSRNGVNHLYFDTDREHYSVPTNVFPTNVFPNKQLHLYTDKENEELLKLLLSLK